MSNHEHFRELIALAAMGQLSSDEDKELGDHLKECEQCRVVEQDYSRILFHELPRADGTRWRAKTTLPRILPEKDVRDRFLARARAEGISFSRDVERPLALSSPSSTWLWRPKFAAVAALGLIVLIGALLVATYRPGPAIASRAALPQTTETDRLNREAARLRETVTEQLAELDAAKKERSLADDSLERLRAELEAERKESAKLSEQLRQSATDNTKLASVDRDKDSLIDNLRAQNEMLGRQNIETLSESVIAQSRIRELSQSFEQATSDLERERQLMTASSEVRKLMGSRNLHIIDVHDVDGNNRSAKAFGRVFYAEGQSLIFYAFDLPNGSRNPAKYAFHAWGERESRPQSPRNLGTFEVDDHDQRRWVLKIDDAALLSGIDSVFVTAESRGDPKEPSGQKLLYAYIAGQPNHP